MNISIFGLGYVGCVGMGCLSKMGHNVIGVDISKEKVSLINNGKATIVEKDIDELIKTGKEKGQIKATTDSYKGVMESDISFICVGTPNDKNGHLDMSAIHKVAENIGIAIKDKNTKHIVVIRSTVMPGTNREIVKIIENVSGKKEFENFAVVSNPEFLREGSAVSDFFNPPYTVLASDDENALKTLEELYKPLKGEVIKVDIEVAELIKFLNNTYHALKVAFANEVGRLCKKLNVDSRQLMDLFCKDKILNISTYYFKPGFAYGGSCLPKDLKALQLLAHDNYTKLPIISSIDVSNDNHIKHAEELIVSKNNKKLSFLSIAFKPGTDDLRFSPALEIIETLIGKGYEIKIFDNNLNLSKLMGKNKEYLFEKLPHIDKLLVSDIKEAIDFGETIVVVNKEQYVTDFFEKNTIDKGKVIIDLASVFENRDSDNIDGICW